MSTVNIMLIVIGILRIYYCGFVIYLTSKYQVNVRSKGIRYLIKPFEYNTTYIPGTYRKFFVFEV